MNYTAIRVRHPILNFSGAKLKVTRVEKDITADNLKQAKEWLLSHPIKGYETLGVKKCL